MNPAFVKAILIVYVFMKECLKTAKLLNELVLVVITAVLFVCFNESYSSNSNFEIKSSSQMDKWNFIDFSATMNCFF